jgi:two-component system OmpR family response regulator
MLSPRLRVLCADGSEDVRLMLSVLLGRQGIELRTASTAAEALGLARAERFDLVMLDDIFPDGDGWELCRRIREFDRETPILFFSGAGYEADRLRGLAAGAQGYIVKPEVGGLVEAIRRLTSPVGA